MTDACNNCGGDALSAILEAPAFDPPARQYTLARCRDCGVVTTTGAAADSVVDNYTPDYYGSGERKFNPLVEWAVDRGARAQAAAITRAWRGDRQAATGRDEPAVLDVGCGRGVLLRAFRETGATVRGLERPEFPLDPATRDVVETAPLSDTVFAGQRFDIVVLRHVLEHLDAQDRVLDTVTARLAPGGLLILDVPNFAGLQRALFAQHWFHLDLPRHLVHLERDWLCERLAARGYTLLGESHTDLLQNIYGFIQSALNALFPGPPNAYYRLLKYGSRRSIPQLLCWSVPAALLAVPAVLESAAGALLRRGATVSLVARRGGET